MSTISFLFTFLLFLSLHVCNARHLGVLSKSSSTNSQFSRRVYHEKVLQPEQIKASSGEKEGDHATIPDKGHAVATIRRDSKAVILKELKYYASNRGETSGLLPNRGETSGSEISNLSGHVGLLRAKSTEGARRKAVSVVGFGSDDVKDDVAAEKDQYHKKVEEESVAVTDYDPPHHTPSIHNRET